MMTKFKFSVMLLGTLLILGGTVREAKAQYDDVSLQTFYDELSPYGTWIHDPQYGYVWRPDVDQAEFRPYYTNGRWVMTEFGNTWVSNYDWGWAPFHYGRWVYTRYNSWLWVPDTTWGPAWVSWRSGGGYYGWAPMAPGIHVNIRIGMPDFCWNFVPYSRIYYHSFPRYYSGRNRVYVHNTVVINNTYINNNRTYYTGPRADDIRRNTRQDVVVYHISRTTNRNGNNRIENSQVNIYTPRPNRGSEVSNPSPRQVVRGNVTTERVNTPIASQRLSRENYTNRFDNAQGVRRESSRVDDSNIQRDQNSGSNSSNSRVRTREYTEPSSNTRSNSNQGIVISSPRSQDIESSSNRVRREVMTTSPNRSSSSERMERPQRGNSQVGQEMSSRSSRGTASSDGMQRSGRGER